MGMSQIFQELNALKSYFTTKRSEIEAAVAAAQSAVLANNKTFYVNSVTGSDANAGTEAAPFKTLNKAINSVPIGGLGTIWLPNVAGMVFEIAADIWLHNKWIDIKGTGALGADKSTYPVIRNKAYAETDGTYATYGLLLMNSVVRISACNVETATWPAAGVPAVRDGFFRRSDFLRGVVHLFSVEVKLGDTAFLRRSLGPSSWSLNTYDLKISEVGLHASPKFVELSGMPIELGMHMSVLPAGKTWVDLIGGVTRHAATGLPLNVVSNLDLSLPVTP